ncbi:MAG: hypothetical protein NT013_25395 [Planctomycetia bacterium]|nr:hypothetical protein [Planctomycetia bacterium]
MKATARRESGLNQRSTNTPRSDATAPHFALITETLTSSTVPVDVPRRSRRRSVAPAVNPLLPYKITLPETVHQRLRLAAIERGMSVSALTAQILDQQLPE